MIRVAVLGAGGRMGATTCAAVEGADDLELAGRADPQLGVEVADVLDAANTKAVFVWGPERVKIEYVEHKPSFSLV